MFNAKNKKKSERAGVIKKENHLEITYSILSIRFNLMALYKSSIGWETFLLSTAFFKRCIACIVRWHMCDVHLENLILLKAIWEHNKMPRIHFALSHHRHLHVAHAWFLSPSHTSSINFIFAKVKRWVKICTWLMYLPLWFTQSNTY